MQYTILSRLHSATEVLMSLLVDLMFTSRCCKGPFIATQLNSTQLDVEFS